jgi:hypothetical protein
LILFDLVTFFPRQKPLSNEVIRGFPDFVHPLLEALFSEIDRLGHRVKERLKLNEGLKKRYLFESPSILGCISSA